MSYPHRRATCGVNDSSKTAMTAMLTGCPVGQEPGCDRTVPVTELKSLDGMMFVLEMPT